MLPLENINQFRLVQTWRRVWLFNILNTYFLICIRTCISVSLYTGRRREPVDVSHHRWSRPAATGRHRRVGDRLRRQYTRGVRERGHVQGLDRPADERPRLGHESLWHVTHSNKTQTNFFPRKRLQTIRERAKESACTGGNLIFICTTCTVLKMFHRHKCNFVNISQCLKSNF